MSEHAEEYRPFLHLDITIARSVAHVAFNGFASEDFERSFFTDLRDMFVPLGRDARVQAVVLAVEPPPASTNKFGQTITTATLEQRAGRFLTIQQLFTELVTFRKPIVAGVTGHANGIIANLALLCDAVVASENATFGDSHVAIGLAAGDGGTGLWPLLVGVGLAKQVLLEGRTLAAAEGHQLGFVSRVVPANEVLAAATDLATRFAGLPRVPYLATKLAINNHLRLGALIATDLTAAYEAATVAEPEFADRHRSKT